MEAWRPPWNATCRTLVGSLTLIPYSGAPPPMSTCLSIYLNLELFLMRVAFLIWIENLKLRITCGTTIVALNLLEWIPLVWPCILLVEIPWYIFSWLTTLLNLTLIINSWTRLFPWASFSLTWSRLLAQIIQLGLNQWQASSHLILRVILTMLSLNTWKLIF